MAKSLAQPLEKNSRTAIANKPVARRLFKGVNIAFVTTLTTAPAGGLSGTVPV